MAADPMSKPLHVAILGGGIAGLTLAIALSSHPQLTYHIYEAAPAFAEIGAGVSFGPNALNAMSLISPRIKSGFERRCTTNAHPSKQDVWFDFQLGMDHAGHGAGTPIASIHAGSTGQTSVHRAHFLDELIALIPRENASFGKRATAITQISGGGVEVHFADGSSVSADIAAGCDGIRSSIRPVVLSSSRSDPSTTAPRYTRKYAYRGLIPMHHATSLLGTEKATNAQMYLGPSGHVLTFPIEHGATMNVVAFRTDASETWGHEEWVLPLPRSKMHVDFAGWGPNVQRILSLMEKPDLWALFEHPPAERYVVGRVVLLGDAAHASTPHCGAGAGMAIEDAYVLSRLLGRVNGYGEVQAALNAYDRVRRPRSQRLVEWSRETGEVYEFIGKGEDEGGDFLKGIGRELAGRFEWIWEHDLTRDLEWAVRVMDEELGLVGGRGTEGRGKRVL